MQNFNFSVPTAFCFGNECIKKNPAIFSEFGKKAFIATSQFFDGCRNYALEDVTQVLDQQGVDYEIYADCIPDPPVQSCVKLTEEVRKYNPDFLIAVGGGSVIDTVKAVDILLKYPDQDPYDVLFGNGAPAFGGSTPILGNHEVGGPNHAAVPFIAVPTTAGTGSEITGAAVLTREDIDNKAGTRPMIFANYAFIDARYIMESPAKLNQSAALDALGHGLEPYIDTGSKDNYMVDVTAEIGFRLFSEFKDALLDNSMSPDDYEKQMLACTIMGIAETQGFTGVPHGLGYPLTHFKEVPHGLACGIFEGEYLKIFKDKTKVMRALELCGFDSIDAFADYVQAVLTQHIEITVTRAEIDEWSQTFFATTWRVERHPEPFTIDDVKAIYERALAKFIID